MGSESDNSSGRKKTIQINQDFFSLSGGKKKRGTRKKTARKKKEKPQDNSKTSKKMRKEFFSKIRALQDKRRKENISVTTKKETTEGKESGFNKAFDESLSFLSNYVKDKKEKKRRKKNKTLKKEKEQLQISLDVPENFANNLDTKPIDVISETPQLKVSVAKRPQYSSMKNGTLPTYRQWMRQQTMKKSKNVKPSISIENKPSVIETERSKKLEMIKAKLNPETSGGKKKKRVMKVKKSTRTIKRKLGKVDGTRKVAVLIKSRKSRKDVQSEKVKLSQVSIIDIKKFLKDKNLIKSGSKAPNDVLRKMYEQAILAGDITNKSEGILLHNYISTE